MPLVTWRGSPKRRIRSFVLFSVSYSFSWYWKHLSAPVTVLVPVLARACRCSRSCSCCSLFLFFFFFELNVYQVAWISWCWTESWSDIRLQLDFYVSLKVDRRVPSLAYRLYEYRGPTSLAINGYYTNHEAEHLLGYVIPLDSFFHASQRGLLRNRSSTSTNKCAPAIRMV